MLQRERERERERDSIDKEREKDREGKAIRGLYRWRESEKQKEGEAKGKARKGNEERCAELEWAGEVKRDREENIQIEAEKERILLDSYVDIQTEE